MNALALKYTSAYPAPTADKPNAHIVFFDVGSQSFRIGYTLDNAEDANGMRDKFGKALEQCFNEVLHDMITTEPERQT